MKKSRLVLALVALLALVPPAWAGNTILFSSQKGDIVFPITPPSLNGSTPGTLDNTVIGGTTPAAGHFTTLSSTVAVSGPVAATTLSASSAVSGAGFTALFASPPPLGTTAPAAATVSQLNVDTGTKTATASAGAATLNKMAGVITSESLSTAAGATYTLTLTDSDIAAADQVMASVGFGSDTVGTPVVTTVTPAAGSVVIVVQNIHATAALSGTIKVAFVVFKN
jgi:hypothetical protein